MEGIFYESLKDSDKKLFSRLSSFNSRLHFHRAYELLYMLDGEADITVGADVYHAETYDIVFVDGYLPHKVHGKNYRNVVIGIPLSMSDDINAAFKGQTLPVKMSDKSFNASLHSVFMSFLSCENENDLFVKGLLGVMIGRLTGHYGLDKKQKPEKGLGLIVDVLNYIDENCEKPLTLALIAGRFGYNKSYFSRLFSKYVSCSFPDYLANVRYNRFVETYDGRKNIAVAAVDAGFSSVSAFYRAKRKLDKNL